MSYSILDVITDTVKGTVEYATNDMVNNRIKLCNECEYLKQTFRTCGQCGCLVDKKTKYAKSTCPIGKW